MSTTSPIPLPATLQWSDPTPFVGRAAERRLLESRWSLARAGTRQVVLIGGEPGVGKTRLVTELAQHAHRQGATVLFGRCDEEPQIPYQPFLESFRHLVEHLPIDVLRAHTEIAGRALVRLAPDLADRVPLPPAIAGESWVGGDDARALAFSAGASLLSATSERTPVLLVVDDLHWAATPTLLLLRHLVRALTARPVMIVGTYRDTELGRTHPFADTLADLRREPDIDRLALSGLDVDGVRQLFTAMRSEQPGQLADTLHEETDGNPFLVVEMIRHLAEGSDPAQLPAGARELIGRRLSRLSHDTDDVLAAAAVIGPEFELGVLIDVVARDEDSVLNAVEEAMRAKLVDECGATRYRFAHALLRQTLLDELSSTRRVRLHRRVGEAIEHRHVGNVDDHLASLAYHFSEAAPGGDLDRAAAYTLRAAVQALDRTAYESAIALTERGLATLEEASDEPDQVRRSELLLVQSMAHERMGVDERLACEAARLAAEAARDAGSARHLADAVWSYCRFVRVGWRGDDAAELAEEALRLLSADDVIHRARVMAVLAINRGFAGERAAARHLADGAVALARKVGDVDTLANALNATAVAHWGTADVEAMRAATEDVFSLGIGPERPYLYLFGMRMRATVQLLDADLAGFDETVATTETVARQVSYGFFVMQSITWRAMRMLLEGRWKEGERILAELIPMSSDPNAFNAWAGLSFISELERGRAARVVPLFEDALANDESLAVFRIGAALGRLDMDDIDGARAHYAAATEDGLGSVVDNWMLPAQLSWLCNVVHRFDDRPMAAALWERLEPYAGRPVVVASGMWVNGAWDRYRGLVASTLGRHDDAVALVQAALEVEGQLGARPHGARSELALAQVLQTRDAPGDRELARAAIIRCLSTAGDLDMRQLVSQASEMLDSL